MIGGLKKSVVVMLYICNQSKILIVKYFRYCSFPGYKYAPNDLLNYAYYYMNEMDNIKKIDTIKIIML